jgi:hypothetical protein
MMRSLNEVKYLIILSIILCGSACGKRSKNEKITERKVIPCVYNKSNPVNIWEEKNV